MCAESQGILVRMLDIFFKLCCIVLRALEVESSQPFVLTTFKASNFKLCYIVLRALEVESSQPLVLTTFKASNFKQFWARGVQKYNLALNSCNELVGFNLLKL